MMDVSHLIDSNFISLQENDLVSSLIGKISRTGRKQGLELNAIVFDLRNNFVGVTDRKKMLKAGTTIKNMKISSITNSSPIVTQEFSLTKAAKLMYDSNITLLPVKKGNKISGVLKAIDIIKSFFTVMDFKAKELASTKLISVQENDSIAVVLRLMREANIEHLPVINQNNLVIGVVSYQDLLEKFLSYDTSKEGPGFSNRGIRGSDVQGKNLQSGIPVSSIMVENIATTSPNAKAREIIELMSSLNISDVILTENKKLVGIVTKRDLLKRFIELQAEAKAIQFSGLHAFDDVDKLKIKQVCDTHFDWLEKILGDGVKMECHLKKSQERGTKSRTEIKCKAITPRKQFYSSSSDGNPITAIESAIAKIKREVSDSKRH